MRDERNFNVPVGYELGHIKKICAISIEEFDPAFRQVALGPICERASVRARREFVYE